MAVTKMCPVCGTKFESESNHAIYCCAGCKSIGAKRRTQERLRQAMEEARATGNRVITPGEKSLTAIIKAAKKAGMSYGEYVSRHGGR